MQGIHRKERENRKRKTLLTHTGLLMEGTGHLLQSLRTPAPCQNQSWRGNALHVLADKRWPRRVEIQLNAGMFASFQPKQ